MFSPVQGTPQHPVPGRLDDHIPTAIDEGKQGEDDHGPATLPDLPAAEPSFDLRAAPAEVRQDADMPRVRLSWYEPLGTSHQ